MWGPRTLNADDDDDDEYRVYADDLTSTQFYDIL